MWGRRDREGGIGMDGEGGMGERDGLGWEVWGKGGMGEGW